MSKIRFKCFICDVDVEIADDCPAGTVCPEHCANHEYWYDRMLGEKRCKHCDQPLEHSKW